MDAITRFLNPHSTLGEWNLVSISGGKWNIPYDKRKTLWSLCVKHCPSFTLESHLRLVYKPQKAGYQPLNFDIDIKTADIVKPFPELLLQFAQRVAKDLQCSFYIVSKDTGYFKDTNKYGKAYCTGGHVYLTDITLSLSDAKAYRKTALGYIPDIFRSLKPLNSTDDILDKCIPIRSNGLMMVGMYKSPLEGGQYKVRYKGNELGYHKIDKLDEEGYEELYGYTFQRPSKQTPIPKGGSKISTLAKCDKFDLTKFLEALTGYSPGDDDYRMLCMYFASTSIDPAVIGKLCNEVWNDTNKYPISETENFVRNYRGKTSVGRGAAQKVLKKNATRSYNLKDIFLEHIYEYHNESIMFEDRSKSWNINEVNKYISDVYSYTWGGGSTTFIYKEKRKKRFGTKYFTTVETVITNCMPFCKLETNKLILIEPTREDLMKELKKAAKMRGKEDEHAKIRMRAKELLKDPHTTTKDILDFVKVEPSEMLLGTMVIKAKQRGLLKSRWHSYTVEPYLHKDRTPSDTLNIFPPFDLLRFSVPGNFKNTAIHEWMWVIWANRDEYKMRWLTNYFAAKLQRPWKKICKFLIAFCRETGVGKTSIRYFLQAIFDKTRVLYCETVSEFAENENSEQLNKLFCVIDDIERCKRKESDSLKSRITADTFRYKKLYQDKVTMPSFIDLIGTSNCPKPVFVGDSDRRVELVNINDEKVNDTVFWNSFYGELENIKVCGSVFNYFANFKIDMDVSLRNCRFDINSINKHKVQNMKLAHRFIAQFFSDNECFERACKNPWQQHNWFDKIRFEILDNQKTVFIAKQRVYDYFIYWKRCCGYKADMKKKTLFDHFAEIHFTPSRKTVEGHKLRGYTFNAPILKKAIACYYKIPCNTLPPFHWVFLDDDEFKEYQRNVWRFRQTK